MKNINILAIILFSLLHLGFLSCSSDEDSDNGGFDKGNAVQFESTIADRDTPKASGDSWASGDEVGIYMIKNATTLVLNNARNVKYSADGDGKLSPAGESIYFPANESTGVDFIAYYPYQATLSNYVYNINLNDQSKPSAIDLLYSNNISGANNSNASVNLEFSHKLTKLAFNITAGQGLSQSSLSNMKVYVNGMNTVADFNLATGLINNNRTKAVITALTTTDGTQAQAIVLPATDIIYSLEFVLSNNATFEWKLDSPVTLYEGKIHNLNVVVGTTQIEVTEGSITDWLGVSDNPTPGTSKPVPVVKYVVGELYPKDGTAIGVVYEISNGGKNGKVVSLKEKQARWGDNSKDELADGVELIRDADNGRQATINLITKRWNAGNFTNDYAIFYWLYNEMNSADVDGKWYIPSKNELKALYAGISGLTYDDIATSWTDGNAMPNFDSANCQAARTAFNNTVKAAGGAEFNFYGQYWAVTEIGASPVWSVHFQTSVLQTSKSKGDAYGRARAVLAF